MKDIIITFPDGVKVTGEEIQALADKKREELKSTMGIAPPDLFFAYTPSLIDALTDD